MDFGLTDDQRDIQRTARELLGSRADARARARARRGRPHRRGAVEGARASSAGRASPSPRSTAARASAPSSWRSCARSSAAPSRPVPFLPTVLAATLIEHAGSDEQRERWLPGLASGELTRRGRRRAASWSPAARAPA